VPDDLRERVGKREEKRSLKTKDAAEAKPSFLQALSFTQNSKPGSGGEDWTADDITHLDRHYGLAEWNPPDAGNAIQERQPGVLGYFEGLATLGGGTPKNDGRYVSASRPERRGRRPVSAARACSIF